MEWHVLIATPHRVQCKQLYTLYSTCPLVAHIDKATNEKEILTPCQLQVFELWKKGLTYKEIAAELQLSFHTVKNHLEDARKRLREHNLPVK